MPSTIPSHQATAQQNNVEPPPSTAWFIYLVQTAKGLLYTGISTDPARRLRQHQGELVGGAKALRGKGPLLLVWQQQAPNRSVASAWEYRLKQLKKADKQRLLTGVALAELLTTVEASKDASHTLTDKSPPPPEVE